MFQKLPNSCCSSLFPFHNDFPHFPQRLSGILSPQTPDSVDNSVVSAKFARRSVITCKFGLFKRIPLWYIETQETRAPRDMQEVSP